MTKRKHFSNEFGVLYSSESTDWRSAVPPPGILGKTEFNMALEETRQNRVRLARKSGISSQAKRFCLPGKVG